jgi:hypothetical protein
MNEHEMNAIRKQEQAEVPKFDATCDNTRTEKRYSSV